MSDSLSSWGRYHGGRRPSSDEFSQFNRRSTIGTPQTEYHEALPSSTNDDVRCDCTFADNRNASRYLVCRVPMVECRLDCEKCRYLTVVGLHDTGPWSSRRGSKVREAKDVTVSTSTFLACHQCECARSSLALGSNFWA